MDDRFDNVDGRAGTRTGQAEQRSTNHAIFAENRHYFLPHTAWIVGAQNVNAKRRLGDAFLANGDNSVSRRYDRISPKIGMLHEVTPDIKIFGNISGSYEPPTFGELAGGPNITPVDAQRATTLEIGTRGLLQKHWGELRWDMSLYRAHVKDELLSLKDDDGNPLGAVNASRTIHQGVEANLGTAWTVRANYLLNDFCFHNDNAYGNNHLAGIPRQVANGEILYQLRNGIYFRPNVWIASSSYIDHANTFQASIYGVLNFKLGRQVSKSLSWFVDARNLGDKIYAATTNVIADAGGRIDRQNFYPGEGRALYAGVELQY